MRKALFALLALPVILGACASGPEGERNQRTATRDDNDYVVGSNLPRRNRMGGDNVSVMTPEQLEQVQRSGAVAPPPIPSN